ncbi:glycosyltransferase family 2 protein [Candidatus Woesearchaeota archaeon]|nr:glycosyltransferase family 2 protein [Candidatus Woesearchaeota archaeon]MBW3006418.1 glycosyltransferase family 2 protein [Candidatus Woesearchaeota archaeon]
MRKNTFIVIAAYNEEKNLPNVISSLKKAGYNNVIAVDDGSKDNTFEVAEKAGATSLKHPFNQGQGAALRTGIRYALQQGAEIIVTFDADGQHRIEDLPAMITPVAEGDVDITLGSRFLRKTKVPLRRKILLKGSVLVIWLFYGIKMTDAHNGFRALSRNAAQKIRITCNRMAHASEIIDEIKRNKLKYKEIPVTIIYTKETLKQGEGSYFGALKILSKMISRKLFSRRKIIR